MAEPGTKRFRGDQGEELVARWLEDQGFEIIGRNVRLGALEVDIVAREGSVVALVEVRTRSPGSLTSGFSSVGPDKVFRLRRAGERLWNRRFRHDPTFARLRFDLAAVTRTPNGAQVEYVRGAF
jgi:putative endonuclease